MLYEKKKIETLKQERRVTLPHYNENSRLSFAREKDEDSHVSSLSAVDLPLPV